METSPSDNILIPDFTGMNPADYPELNSTHFRSQEIKSQIESREGLARSLKRIEARI